MRKDIRGYEQVCAVFGHETVFHDDEVLSVVLQRDVDKTNVTLEVKLAIVGAKAPQQKKCLCMKFIGVYEFTLDDFNYQNVLSGITVERKPGGELEVKFHAIFGAQIELLCRSGEMCLED